MTLLSHLSDLAGAAFSKLGYPAELGEVVPSQRPELAQFQCNGAMSAAKTAGRPPAEIAAEVVAILETEDEIAGVEVAPPGFINLTLNDQALARWAGRSAGDEHLGYPPTETPENVVVDYAGPNVSKAMHVGHLRATIIGDSLARLFTFAGHHVIRDPHFGDWGFNMGLLIAAIEESQPDLPFFDPDVSDYPEQSARLPRRPGAALPRGRSPSPCRHRLRRPGPGGNGPAPTGRPGISRLVAAHEIRLRGGPTRGLRRAGGELRPLVRRVRRPGSDRPDGRFAHRGRRLRGVRRGGRDPGRRGRRQAGDPAA